MYVLDNSCYLPTYVLPQYWSLINFEKNFVNIQQQIVHRLVRNNWAATPLPFCMDSLLSMSSTSYTAVTDLAKISIWCRGNHPLKRDF